MTIRFAMGLVLAWPLRWSRCPEVSGAFGKGDSTFENPSVLEVCFH